MRKILLVLEYDGSAYAGWQIQANGLSVQEVVEAALAKVVGERVRLVSASRTDAGVHARGMTAHFQTERDLPTTAYREGVNRFLPLNVAVREVKEVPGNFHARFDARDKWYRYTLYLDQVRSPRAAGTSWHIRASLDVERMRREADLLVGTHDFALFRTSRCDARTTIREIQDVSFSQIGKCLHIDVRGTGFLRNMVRIIVGTLVEIGKGKRPAGDIGRLLRREKSVRSGLTAPPQGLCLMEVRYGERAEKEAYDNLSRATGLRGNEVNFPSTEKLGIFSKKDLTCPDYSDNFTASVSPVIITDYK